jgi:type IV secretion system protein VirB10
MSGSLPPSQQRGLSAVRGRRAPMQFWKVATLVGVVAGVLIVGVFWRGDRRTRKDAEKPTTVVLGQVVEAAQSSYYQDPPAAQPASIMRQTPAQPASVASPLPVPAGPPPPPPPPPPSLSMLNYGGSSVSAAPAATQDQTRQQQTAGGSVESGDWTRVNFKPSTLPGAKAGKPLDLYYTMMPQLIHCTLDTAMDTSVPGPVMCHLPNSVYSPKGVVLMRDGTQVVGEYRSMQQGQHSIFTLAATAITPEGVPVPLDSPMSDGLGRAGVPGEVNNHTLPRFGGAVLLGATQTAFSALQSLAQSGQRNGGGNSYMNLNTGSAESVMAEALKAEINIPPSLTKAEGEDVTIFVRYPIEFPYKLTLRQ